MVGVPTTGREHDVITVILGGGRGQRLDPLTSQRSKPAVPIAGKYRLIDIPIGNCIHSGMERMFLLTQFNSVSLHRHIVRTYAFDHFSKGFVQILAAQQTPGDETWYQGTADAVRQNLDFIVESRGDYVMILSGDHMYRMDYRLMLREHLESNADLTIGVLPCPESEIGEFGAVRTDPTGRIVEFREKPKDAAAREGMQADPQLLTRFGLPTDKPYLASMGIYIFNKDVLAKALRPELRDFGHHVIPSLVKEKRVQAYAFGGYWRDIGTIRSFYDAHMDLVKADPPFSFRDPNWLFYTHPRYLPGSVITATRFNNGILCEGTQVVGSTIEDSIVGVRSILNHATVRRSLIMGLDPYFPPAPAGSPPPGIGEGTLIQNAIVDKNAHIGRNVRITNKQGLQEAEGPGWAIREGIVIVRKNAVIPDETTI
jgi:glucose-1-phosphate adenylyltransferase